MYKPLPPAEDGEQPKFKFSTIECLCFAFHQLVKGRHAAFLAADEHADRLKDFRQRLVGVQSSVMVCDGVGTRIGVSCTIPHVHVVAYGLIALTCSTI